MSELHDEDDRPRSLTNRQVLAFMAGHWLREPGRFALIIALVLVATVCDLSIPWATRGLINAVSSPERVTAAAWAAWAALSALYLTFYMSRTSMFRIMNGFYARIMSRMVKEGFARVQAYSSDWHASNFAGATVRRVSRAMWGYDSASDALIAMLIPTVLVLGGLAISLGLHWPWAGVFVAIVVLVFAAYNVLMSVYYVRPANLRSTALDSEIGAALADSIGANPTVKSFGAEQREEARFAETADAWRWAVNKTWDRFNVVGFGQNILLIILQAGLTGFLVHAWSQGRATPGDVAFAITSFIVMAGYMRNFSEITQMLQKGLDDMLDVATYMRTNRSSWTSRALRSFAVRWARSSSIASPSATPTSRARSTRTSAWRSRRASGSPWSGPPARASRPSSSSSSGFTICRAAGS
ncbi:ABC transporter ATP-binding protein [Phenylobacterium koreense]|uniref:ABC-type multidrug transport system fused ATPase/permease subunit n=1 Tax=Phenylobacterium koreense TaxID=266125 RepID=A0ABV2EFU2_9CAUL